MIETLGWIATTVFVASYFFSRPGWLRAAQMGGAMLWIVYGCLIGAVPVFALDDNRDNRDTRTANYDRDRHSVIDDVVKMSQAGVSDESIIRFVRQSRDRYVVNADTIIALNDAHVSKAVINALMDGAYDRGGRQADDLEDDASDEEVYSLEPR